MLAHRSKLFSPKALAPRASEWHSFAGTKRVQVMHIRILLVAMCLRPPAPAAADARDDAKSSRIRDRVARADCGARRFIAGSAPRRSIQPTPPPQHLAIAMSTRVISTSRSSYEKAIELDRTPSSNRIRTVQEINDRTTRKLFSSLAAVYHRIGTSYYEIPIETPIRRS